jgi:epimerase transport system membrane fusion protein
MASEYSAARPIPTDDRRIRTIGLAVVLGIFGGLGTWSALAPLSSAAVAPGVVTVASYRKTVQHLEGGIVKAIHVRDGDRVARGHVLIALDDTQPRAQLEVLRGQYFISLAREARLLAQRDGLDQVRYPPMLMEDREDARVQDAIRVQNQTFKVRKLAKDGEISLYQSQIEQFHARAHGLRAQQKSRDRLVSSYRTELEDFQVLQKEGYAAKQKVREIERNLAHSEGQHGELLAEIAASELQISETRLKILQLTKEFQREVAKELSEVQTDLFGLREKLQSLQSTVERTVIKAPESGMVLGLSVHTIGAVIPPGGKLLDLVPQNEKLLAEAQVSPLDIDRVRVGQTAEIRFTAFKSRDTPKIDGTLIAISADRLIEEKEKTPYYLARVEIAATGLRDLARNGLELVPGMPAEVLINTGDRTLFQYLVAPLRNTFARSLTED